MLNPANGDPVHVVSNYVEEYLDLVESLPFDLQRSVSLMKEIDATYQGKSFTFHPLTNFASYLLGNVNQYSQFTQLLLVC